MAGSEIAVNLNRFDLKGVLESKAFQELRYRFWSKSGWHRICHQCQVLESCGQYSLRRYMNQLYSKELKAIGELGSEIQPTGTILRCLDIRLSNLCNCRCRTCNSWNSTAWGGGPGLRRLLKECPTFETQFRSVLPFLNQLRFGGGEPLITPEHYKLLNLVLEGGCGEGLALKYSSNLTVLRTRRWDVLRYWCLFPRVHVDVSIDGLGPHAEIIRNGQCWATLVDNLKQIRQEAPHVTLICAPTVSALNIFQLPDLHRYLIEHRVFLAGDFYFNLLLDPSYYSVQILPTELKAKAARMIETHMRWLSELGLPDQFLAIWQGLIEFMNGEDRDKEFGKFIEVTSALDRQRGENSRVVLPEFQQFYQ